MLNEQITTALAARDYDVEQCFDGDSGLVAASSNRHDLILLDIMLPQRNGLSLLNVLRRQSDVPVVIVSARHAEEERIKGLTAGADDYLSKPFSIQELVLRIDAILRRSQATHDHSLDYLEIDQLSISKRQHSASIGHTPLLLTPTEFSLLWALAANSGEVLPRAYLYQTVLKRAHSAYDRSLDMHLSRVRRKLTATGWDGNRLKTVHGRGYCLT